MPDQPLLSRRALNRALLARQSLLARADLPATGMIEHLVGLQAQNPRDPYVALWSRLRDFEVADLERLLIDRDAVRIPSIRTTLHLLTARDAVRIWPLVQPVLEKVLRSTPFGKATAGLDREALLVAGRELLDGGPLPAAELASLLAERWPGEHGPSMAQVARYLLPVLQPPPRGLWTSTGRPTWTTVEAWLGRPVADPMPPDELVTRYLAAFGPATVADARTWSWLTGLREVFERLRPRLVTFRDERGREVFDLPDAPRPDPETAAPPRFLPEYENLLLSHDDRTRVIPEEVAPRLTGFVGSFLVDGYVHGQWRVDVARDGATLVLDAFLSLEGTARDETVAEAERLLAWVAPAAARRVVVFGTAREPSRRR